MENNNIVNYLFLGLGIITIILAIKPTRNIKRFKNLFWILGNLFFVIAFIFKYLDGHSINYAAIIMLLYANFEMARQLNKKIE